MIKMIDRGWGVFKTYGVEVETENGTAFLLPCYCEITGKHICWRNHIPIEVMRKNPDCTPAYVSFDIVDDEGNQLVDISDITTF
jgi:hypothetical protein